MLWRNRKSEDVITHFITTSAVKANHAISLLSLPPSLHLFQDELLSVCVCVRGVKPCSHSEVMSGSISLAPALPCLTPSYPPSVSLKHTQITCGYCLSPPDLCVWFGLNKSEIDWNWNILCTIWEKDHTFEVLHVSVRLIEIASIWGCCQMYQKGVQSCFLLLNNGHDL